MPYKIPERKKENQKKRAALQRRTAIALLGGRCVDCGEADPARLHFDHKDPKEKSFTVGLAFGRFSWERIIAELMKCELRCAPCHYAKTNANGDNRIGHGAPTIDDDEWDEMTSRK